MRTARNGAPPVEPEPRPHPGGWTPSDALLETRIEAERRRIDADERRLAAEERGVRWNRWLVLAALLLLALTIAALVTSVIALDRDIESVATAEPREASVGSDALQDAAVTQTKLAGGAVTSGALADGSVTAEKLAEDSVTDEQLAAGSVTAAALAPRSIGTVAIAPLAVAAGRLADDAVTGAKVAPDSLTGADIRESTLDVVRRATRADSARTAAALGGIPAASYLFGIEVARVATDADLQPLKGPITATCPTGTRVVAGGAAVEGVSRGVAVLASTPSGTAGWYAAAQAFEDAVNPWRLVVTAVCAAGGD